MEKYFEPLITWLASLATTMSLEVFVVVAGFLEEIIAPIPSPFVMTTAAVLAKTQGYNAVQIGLLVLLAAAAKTASSYLIYVITDKAEDIVVGKFGKYFGVSHAHIEKIGKFLNKSWWDDVLLFLSRALPFVPTSVVTVAAGVIKYNPRSFILMTFLGSIVRNLFFLWVAYYGIDYLDTWWHEFRQNPFVIALGVTVLVAGLIAAYKAKDWAWEKILHQGSTKESKE